MTLTGVDVINDCGSTCHEFSPLSSHWFGVERNFVPGVPEIPLRGVFSCLSRPLARRVLCSVELRLGGGLSGGGKE